VFYVAAVLNIIAAVTALAVLKPMRMRVVAQQWSPQGNPAQPTVA